MKNHRFIDIWPEMTGKAYRTLKADIAANGQVVPVLIWRDAILDGRARERACAELGIEPRREEADCQDEEAALAIVISLNNNRRHLSVTERAFIAAKLANILKGHNQYAAKIVGPSDEGSTSPTSHSVSVRAAAKTIDVSASSVDRARVVLRSGTESDVDDVMSGRVALHVKCNEIRDDVRGQPSGRAGKVGRKPGRKAAATKRPQTIKTYTNIVPFLGPDTPPKVGLTPEEVDPNFKGTRMEFVDTYGLVQLTDAKGRARQRFQAWVSNMRALGKTTRALPEWPKVDHDWLLEVTDYDIVKLTEAVETLRPKLSEAEALLAKARSLKDQKTREG